MTKQSFEYLDLGLLVVVLGIVISLGVTTLYKTNRQVQLSSQNFMEDKNTGRSRGYLRNKSGLYDGTLSKMQVVLLTQIQDYNMPFPRNLRINGSSVDIPVWYKEARYESGQNVWNIIKHQDSSTRYSMVYQYNLDENEEIVDEYFEIKTIQSE